MLALPITSAHALNCAKSSALCRRSSSASSAASTEGGRASSCEKLFPASGAGVPDPLDGVGGSLVLARVWALGALKLSGIGRGRAGAGGAGSGGVGAWVGCAGVSRSAVSMACIVCAFSALLGGEGSAAVNLARSARVGEALRAGDPGWRSRGLPLGMAEHTVHT